MDTAFDRSQRLLQHFRDLVVFESVKIQQERIAEDLRQFVNGCLDILYPQIALRPYPVIAIWVEFSRNSLGVLSKMVFCLALRR